MLLEGFEHELLDYGFEDTFYEYLIVQDELVTAIFTKPIIFHNDTSKNYTYGEFIYHIIAEHQSIDYQHLIDILADTYGLKLELYQLKDKLKNTEAYYSSATEKYYIDKDRYYLEVYGK